MNGACTCLPKYLCVIDKHSRYFMLVWWMEGMLSLGDIISQLLRSVWPQTPTTLASSQTHTDEPAWIPVGSVLHPLSSIMNLVSSYTFIIHLGLEADTQTWALHFLRDAIKWLWTEMHKGSKCNERERERQRKKEIWREREIDRLRKIHSKFKVVRDCRKSMKGGKEVLKEDSM